MAAELALASSGMMTSFLCAIFLAYNNCHPAECRIHVHGLARPVGNPPPAPPAMTREDIIFLARVISDLDDLAERDAASRDFAATDHKTKGKFDQGDIRFGRLVFTAPKRLAPLGAD
jgi:hypothetical protein